MTGRVVHFEIPFDDDQRAAAFYRDAFGWTITPVPDLDYTMVATGPLGEDGMPTEAGYIGGGMFRREQPLSHPVVMIDVPDLRAALARVTELGGRVVVDAQRAGDYGVSAYVEDTEGNVIGLWQELTEPGQG